MTAAANAIEELQRGQHLTNKGLRFIVRRIDPATNDWLAETYAPTLHEAIAEAKQGTKACYYELRLLHGDKLLRRVRGQQPPSLLQT